MTGFDTSGRQPSAAHPLGNPEYGVSSIPSQPKVKGTAGGGPNYIDHLVTTYNCSEILSYNFAMGGTVVDTSVVKGGAPDLRQQVSDIFGKKYVTAGPTAGSWNKDNSLFLIFMGDNDVQGSYKSGTPVDKLMESYSTAVDDLYKFGARKFPIVTVPPLDRAPSHNLTHDTAEENKKLVTSIENYNKGLHTQANDLKNAHKDVQVEIYEFNDFLKGVLDQPKKFGFKDATCEGDGSKTDCIWWKPSDGHTTSALQNRMAEDMKGTMEKFGW